MVDVDRMHHKYRLSGIKAAVARLSLARTQDNQPVLTSPVA